MNNNDKELKIQNLITLRNNFFNIVIVLSGGIAGLLLTSDINYVKFTIIVIGIYFDILFILNVQGCTSQIKNLIEGK
ncbi:MAG: hypothetical protein LUH05_07220 [Candidatus Gastranaerophilales bacterium]|nr:hypothetical protein [Candidatus Gastranaerophilales bacterium]